MQTSGVRVLGPAPIGLSHPFSGAFPRWWKTFAPHSNAPPHVFYCIAFLRQCSCGRVLWHPRRISCSPPPITEHWRVRAKTKTSFLLQIGRKHFLSNNICCDSLPFTSWSRVAVFFLLSSRSPCFPPLFSRSSSCLFPTVVVTYCSHSGIPIQISLSPLSSCRRRDTLHPTQIR